MLCTILITNDDGIHALGIRKLVECLHERANVYIVAPAKEKSSAGYGVTLRAPLCVDKIVYGKVK
ncbi:5'/3'-nucleotidase SurE [Aneurinibacillus migulanus]|uniref:5'/3'-nucleotidase SurE n=1 Tax=Aneurinibacillus migulanus TaxID=47500 RepID=UPI002E211B22|nr:5'/3'-nucleotidase SurE [Aneurinibacillus migulanus]MED4730740.1 5'/3'-nucleotidase SurE [Aneurinibacillus migulanus]